VYISLLIDDEPSCANAAVVESRKSTNKVFFIAEPPGYGESEGTSVAEAADVCPIRIG
jgi:hypothetical protein